MIRLRDERDYNYALKLYRYQEQVAELFKIISRNKDFNESKEAYRALKIELAREKNFVSEEGFCKQASAFLVQYVIIIKTTMANGFKAITKHATIDEMYNSVYEALDELNYCISHEDLRKLILAYGVNNISY